MRRRGRQESRKKPEWSKGKKSRGMPRIGCGDKLPMHPVPGTAVTLNCCIPSFLLSSHSNSRGGVLEVFLLPPLTVL